MTCSDLMILLLLFFFSSLILKSTVEPRYNEVGYNKILL